MHEKDDQVEQVADLPETGDLTLQYDTDGIQHATSWDTGAEQNISRPQETKCDVTTGVEASDKKLFLCLSFKSFLEHDILKGRMNDLFVTVYGDKTNRTRIPIKNIHGLQFVVGRVFGSVFSSVTGYVVDKVFYGSIFVDNEIYYVDPYRNTSTVTVDSTKNYTALPDSPMAPRTVETLPATAENMTLRRRRSVESPGSAREARVCSLALVADHIFHQEVGGGDVSKTVLIMLFHIKEANAVFMTKDFDVDGESDCVGLEVSAISIMESEESYVNILLGDYQEPEDFLRRFSRYNFAGHCLGLLFTNRLFKDLVLGLAWRGNPAPGGVGGTCQERARYSVDGKTYSFNCLFISMKSQQQSRIPLKMAVLNLVHELMHAFGAKHDPEETENPACTPHDAETNGRYLMSKYSNNGKKHNHELLSPCTKDSVRRVLAAEHRTSCLARTAESYCGDGVVSAGEECDCGSDWACLLARACCTPNTHPAGGCSTRKDC